MNKLPIRFVFSALAFTSLSLLLTWQFAVHAQLEFPASRAEKPNTAIAWTQPLLTAYRRIQNLDSYATSAITLTAYNQAGSVQRAASA